MPKTPDKAKKPPVKKAEVPVPPKKPLTPKEKNAMDSMMRTQKMEAEEAALMAKGYKKGGKVKKYKCGGKVKK